MDEKQLRQLIKRLSTVSYSAKQLDACLRRLSENKRQEFYDNLVKKNFQSEIEVSIYLGL